MIRRVVVLVFVGSSLLIGGAVLGYRLGADLSRRVVLPSYFYNDMGDYVSAHGTWVMAGELQAWPVQTTKVTCTIDDMLCRETTAIVSDGIWDPVLSVLEEVHEIARWDTQEIVTQPKDKGCVRYILTIDRQHRQVLGRRITIDATSPPCKGMDLREFQLRLVDGLESKRLASDR